MKTMTVFITTLILLITAFSAIAQDDPIYGRKLMNISKTFLNSIKPDTPRPVYGTIPDEEWKHYDSLSAAAWQKDPTWSPDGSLIAFTSDENIYIVPAEGGLPTRVYNGMSYYEYEGKQYYIKLIIDIESLCFSPDGTEIFFGALIVDEALGSTVKLEISNGFLTGLGLSTSIPVIKAVNIETGETRIVDDYASDPQFSRNGKYFLYKDGFRSSFIVRELSSGKEWMHGEMHIRRSCFSGNGNSVIYEENSQFFRNPVIHGEREQLSFDEKSTYISRRYKPDSSPDGNFVLFNGNAGSYSSSVGGRTSSLEKIGILSVETGLSYPLVPLEGGAESTSAKFSPDGTKICYTMRNRDIYGSQQEIYIKEFDDIMIQTQIGTEKPASFAINGNYPNPFNPTTTIEFSLPEAGFANLVVYNVMGQKVKELISEYKTPGIHTVVWNGRNDNGLPVSAGIYVTRLQMHGATATGRMMLVK